MDRKFLEGLGLEKEVIDKVLDQNGAETTALRTQITTKETEVSTLRTDLVAANGKIAELEKVDVQDLQTKLQEEKDGRVADKKDFAIRSLLANEGCSDVDYVLYKLGNTVEFDADGKVKDPENFVKLTKEKHASQFQVDAAGGTGGTGNFARDHSDRTPEEKNPYTQKGWNLTEQMRLEISDSEKSKKLKIEAKIE